MITTDEPGLYIEDAYGITIEDEKAAELTTVRQVVDYLEKNA